MQIFYEYQTPDLPVKIFIISDFHSPCGKPTLGNIYKSAANYVIVPLWEPIQEPISLSRPVNNSPVCGESRDSFSEAGMLMIVHCGKLTRCRFEVYLVIVISPEMTLRAACFLCSTLWRALDPAGPSGPFSHRGKLPDSFPTGGF